MIAADSDYRVQIQQFQGPLDLLLHLIGKARIDIEQIFVSEVTGQYIAYVAKIPHLSMDGASEFLEMAATLVFIKSRMLLPGNEEEVSEEDDPEQELIARLKAYKTYKDAAEALKERERLAQDVYYKLPEELLFAEEKWEIEQMTLHDLTSAYLDVLQRKPDAHYERMEEVEIQKDMFTIRDRSRFILRTLTKMGSASFFSLFSGAHSRLEIAVTFTALLELIQKSLVVIRQEKSYSDILITKKNEEAAV